MAFLLKVRTRFDSTCFFQPT